MPQSNRIASLFTALAVLGCASACSFSASMQAGSKSPEENAPAAAPPSTSEPENTETQTTPPEAQKAKVKVTGSKIEPEAKIVFQLDSAVFHPDSSSEAVLAEIKTYLEQNPRVTRLRIEGHTHNLRPSDQALQLSGQRALTVKQWLIARGINEGRLLAVGFGDAKPVASNADSAGQAQNERIEFRIAELDGKPYLGPDPLAGGTEFP